MDILQKAREEIIKERVSAVESPPSDFSRPYNSNVGLAGGGALGTLGLVLGSHTGLALFGTAISGAWVLAPLLGIVGLAAGTLSQNKK
jgi:fatty acid desaturase